MNWMNDVRQAWSQRSTGVDGNSLWPLLLFALIVLSVCVWALFAIANDARATTITALATAVLGVAGIHVGHVAGHRLATKQLSAVNHLSPHPVVASLDKLNELRTKGALTEDEYVAGKAKVLE